jgi:hypothetical protein
MKKVLGGIVVLLGLILIGVYVAVPAEIKVSQSNRIGCTLNPTVHYLTNQNKWNRWWPKENIKTNENSSVTGAEIYSLRGYQYSIINSYYNAVEILIQKDSFKVSSRINILPAAVDSQRLEWETMITPGSNPFKKIKSYQQATVLKENMEEILRSLNLFLENKQNIYGVEIRKSTVKDTLLVATRWETSAEPGTREVYQSIDLLKQYISSQGGRAVGYPMLNIHKLDSIHYVTTVAVPTDKKLNGNDKEIFFKHMVPGNILETEVKGGPITAAHSIETLKTYIADYHEMEIAMPFQSLVTDRRDEPDTNRWVTKAYYPIY